MKVAILFLCSYVVATYGTFGYPEQTQYPRNEEEARREYEERLREHYRRYPDARYPERGYAAPVSTPAPPPIADPASNSTTPSTKTNWIKGNKIYIKLK
jgi:hypothetical protein